MPRGQQPKDTELLGWGVKEIHRRKCDPGWGWQAAVDGSVMESIRSQLSLLFLGCFSPHPACTTCQALRWRKPLIGSRERLVNFPPPTPPGGTAMPVELN